MTLRLYPLPTLFDADVATLKSATSVLVSGFYVRRPYTVPWSVNTTAFVLETSEPASLHTFNINDSETFTIIPGAEVVPLQLQLVQGANSISIRTDEQFLQESVAATAVETWFRALGREYYLASARRLREVSDQLNSPWTTRVSAHFYPFNDLFIPARMPKIQQTRFAILASMGGRLGHGDGVTTVATALSYSTPYVTKPRNSEFNVPGLDNYYPGVTTFPTMSEDKGRLLDLWYPNQCLAAKLALHQLALSIGSNDASPKPLELVDFNDYQVILKSGGFTEVHTLNPLSAECSDINTDTSCLPSRLYLQLNSTIDAIICSPQLAFDEAVENPINFGFWDEGNNLDMSAGSDSPGLGGGDDQFDTVDPDDLFGNGFAGVSLSRRLDGACLDSRVQRGQRLSKFVFPLQGSSTATPFGEVTGSELRVDAAAGATAPTLGTSVLWGVSPRRFLYQGDYVRFEEPDTDIQVLKAWPLFDVNYVVKSGDVSSVLRGSEISKGVTITNGSATVTGTGTSFTIGLNAGDTVSFGSNPAVYTILAVVNDFKFTLTTPYVAGLFPTTNLSLYLGVGTQQVLVGDAGFFEKRFEGKGVRVGASELASVVAVSADGSEAVIAGNASIPTGGPLICSVYDPIHDRADLTFPPYSGRLEFEVTLSSPLLADQADKTILDYHCPPRVVGNYLAGVSTLLVMSDTVPLPGDQLYVSQVSALQIDTAIDTGLVHHTTGLKVYRIQLLDSTASPFVDNQILYNVSAECCWPNGAPVTPLMLLSLAPPAYLVP